MMMYITNNRLKWQKIVPDIEANQPKRNHISTWQSMNVFLKFINHVHISKKCILNQPMSADTINPLWFIIWIFAWTLRHAHNAFGTFENLEIKLKNRSKFEWNHIIIYLKMLCRQKSIQLFFFPFLSLWGFRAFRAAPFAAVAGEAHPQPFFWHCLLLQTNISQSLQCL